MHFLLQAFIQANNIHFIHAFRIIKKNLVNFNLPKSCKCLNEDKKISTHPQLKNFALSSKHIYVKEMYESTEENLASKRSGCFLLWFFDFFKWNCRQGRGAPGRGLNTWRTRRRLRIGSWIGLSNHASRSCEKKMKEKKKGLAWSSNTRLRGRRMALCIFLKSFNILFSILWRSKRSGAISMLYLYCFKNESARSFHLCSCEPSNCMYYREAGPTKLSWKQWINNLSSWA